MLSGVVEVEGIIGENTRGANNLVEPLFSMLLLPTYRNST